MATIKHLTLAEMAQRLSLAPRTLKKYVVALEIPHFKAGKILRFDAEVVEAYLLVTEQPKTEETKVRAFPVKKARGKVIASTRFAEAG